MICTGFFTRWWNVPNQMSIIIRIIIVLQAKESRNEKKKRGIG